MPGMSLRNQARIRLVVVAWILAGPGSAMFSVAPAGAAVAVMVNACDGEAVVTTEPVWGSARTQRVAPNATAAVFLPQALSARVTVGTTTAEVTLRPWEIHTLLCEEGTLRVENALTARAQPPLWLAPAILAEPPRQVIIPVAIYADDAQPARQSVWEPRLRAQLAAVSEVLTATCGVGLQVTTVGRHLQPTAPEQRVASFVRDSGQCAFYTMQSGIGGVGANRAPAVLSRLRGRKAHPPFLLARPKSGHSLFAAIRCGENNVQLHLVEWVGIGTRRHESPF